ncbi:hypothetical protein RQP46_001844 [Phenoliferia psychrophenolica]
MSQLRSTSPTRSVSPSSSPSHSPRFQAVDTEAPTNPPPALNPNARGASNTGPKGVLADYNARKAVSHTGPKGVLADYSGSQAAAAASAMANLSLVVPILNIDADDEELVDGDENAAIERYRRNRIAEMSGSGARGPGRGRKVFGHLREIGMDQFLTAVEEEDPDVAVVLHLYEPGIEACFTLNTHLSSLARAYPHTKFIRALATEVDFAADNEDDALPTVIVYRGGELESTLVRLDRDWGSGTKQEVLDLLIRFPPPPVEEDPQKANRRDEACTRLHPGAREMTNDVESASVAGVVAAPESPVETLASPPVAAQQLPPQDEDAPTRHDAASAPGPTPPSPPLPSTPTTEPPPLFEPIAGEHEAEPAEPLVLRPRAHKLAPRGILKPPTVAPSRFSFRRDILQPFNTRLAYAGGYPATTQSPASASSTEFAPASSTGGNTTPAAGGFWGSALKRLTVATNAAVAGVPLPLALARDAPLDDAHPTAPAVIHTNPTALTAHDHPHSAEPGVAPHTPTKGVATALPATASPYATIRAAAQPPAPAGPPPPPPLSVGELKKVRFRMATLKVIYPINGPNGPLAPWEEGKTKKRVNTEYRASRHRQLEAGGESKGWTGEDLARLYAECCRTREEPGIERVRRALRENPKVPPKSLDLSNELLSHGAIEALSDLLSVDFGLKKLTLESCGLDDESLKPLLHALLVSGSLPTLSLANNKRIKAKGWKLIAIFTRKARFLRYLDLSENSMDRKAAEYLVQALTPYVPPIPNSSLSLDALPAPSATTPAPSPPLNPPHADEQPPGPQYLDDGHSDDDDPEPLFTVAPLLKDGAATAAATVLSIRLENCGLKSQALEALAHGVRSSGLKHISIRRNRISALGAVAVAIMIRDFPVASDHSALPLGSDAPSLPSSPVAATSSSGAFESSNSVTARQTLQAPYVRKTPAAPSSPRASSPEGGVAAAHAEREAWKNSEARNRLRRQIEELPRTGSLLTLDVKGNDIRNGVTYIAQVLKRNRTLKVLNLSENKIDVQGLVSIAEALKFNSTLETLDMSINPCCGPGLEGITTLRAAITINSNLKRVFLNNTDLSSEGAIALAEFLPEATSLIHLDLTGNFDIDIAGVLALSVSVKMNHTLRCLDLNIPANDPDFARLSQEILQCCVRNTEIAQEESLARGNKVTIAAPILKSVVARDLKTRQENEDRERRNAASASQSKDDILLAADECRIVLGELLAFDIKAKAQGVIVAPSEVVKDLLINCQLAEAQLAETVLAGGTQKDRAVALGEQLTALLDQAKSTYDAPAPHSAPTSPTLHRINGAPTHLSSPTLSHQEEHVSSPSFSIADSDDEEDDNASNASPSPVATEGPELPTVPRLVIPESMSEDADAPKSPMQNQSRAFTEEEGEVFRRGTALETVDDEALDDVSGEELRKEILETPVQRSPRLSITSSDGRPDVSFLKDGS